MFELTDSGLERHESASFAALGVGGFRPADR